MRMDHVKKIKYEVDYFGWFIKCCFIYMLNGGYWKLKCRKEANTQREREIRKPLYSGGMGRDNVYLCILRKKSNFKWIFDLIIYFLYIFYSSNYQPNPSAEPQHKVGVLFPPWTSQSIPSLMTWYPISQEKPSSPLLGLMSSAIKINLIPMWITVVLCAQLEVMIS